MKYTILLFLEFICAGLSEWVALPSVHPKPVSQQKLPFKEISIRNVTEMTPRRVVPTIMKLNHYNTSFIREESTKEVVCPDIHNLTMMMYAKGIEKLGPEKRNDEIPLDEIKDEHFNFNNNYPKTSSGKYTFLKSLETKIMNQIEERISNLEPSSRMARGKHLGFPSMEGALVSISLLLFAVYLIKLVLKILQHLHNKKGQTDMSAMLSNIRAPFTVIPGRRKRSYEMEAETIHLLHLIDKYNLRFG